MSKKRSSSTSLKKPEPVVQQAKRVSKPGKIGKEIDDIFAQYRRSPEVQQPETRETKSEIATVKRVRTTENNNNPESEPRKRTNDGFRGKRNNNPESEPRKRTNDGFRVFTEDEIGFNKANSGGTPLCPFDCNCCF